MIKFLLKFFLIFLVIIISSIIFLSYVGLETDKFDSFIKNKANEVNKNVKLEFNKTKIHLDISDLKLHLKLQDPKVLLKNDAIDLLKLDLFLSLRSFYTSDFLLEKVNIAFERNDIKDLTKITNIFLPKIINKQLKKIFVKGNLEGAFVIPFESDGTISKKYSFQGKVIDADIDITKEYKLKNFTADIVYGDSSSVGINDLRVIINKGTILNLQLSKSLIDIKFEENKKFIKSSIHTKGNINFSQIKKIANLLGGKIDNLDDINVTSDLITNIEFNIDNKFKIRNISYVVKGNINNFKAKIKEKKIIREFLPSFETEIILKNAKINFKALNGIKGDHYLNIEGIAKFGENFESVNINEIYKKKTKKYQIS